ncbi:MAG: hypothetical protein EOP04_03525 [Proteobacteria bacterium]|nr:MAG: hypothetical protein EOP04_03525 [Pseudomonadota bacterium]
MTCFSSSAFAFDFNFTSKERGLMAVGGGCVAGYGMGHILDSQDNSPHKSPAATKFASSLIGCATGAAWSYFFDKDREPSLLTKIEQMNIEGQNRRDRDPLNQPTMAASPVSLLWVGMTTLSTSRSRATSSFQRLSTGFS